MTPDQPKENNTSNNSSKAFPKREGRGEAIDLNCDMGEGSGNDALIMPFISSANIACGYHAGDERTIWQTIELALYHNVAVGAHVSFLDKKNFGRSEMNLLPTAIYELVQQQLIVFKEIADSFDITIAHVKPHGALYNMSVKDAIIAKAIAQAIKDFDESLILFGLSGSVSVTEAKNVGLRTASEVFADRTYQDNGSLTPRSQANALINDTTKAILQVLQMINQGTVTSVSRKDIPIIAETICIHGDGEHAAEFAKAIHQALIENKIAIRKKQ